MTRHADKATSAGEDGANVGPAGRKRGEEGYAAWLDVFQAQTLVGRALEKIMKQEFRLPLADYEVLSRLAAVPEGKRVRMQELARKVLLSKSGLSQLFTKLERRGGLVERRGDPKNLRVTYATITAEGREAGSTARPRSSRTGPVRNGSPYRSPTPAFRARSWTWRGGNSRTT